MKKFDLEERLIDYVIMISNLTDKIDKTMLGVYIANQLIRSGTSPALNYGEAQSAESRKDFIHKMKIVLKELKESRIALKIVKQKPLVSKPEDTMLILKETEELIAIIYKSIETAKANLNK